MGSARKSQIIDFEPREIKLKRKVRAHLASLGFTRDSSGALLAPGVGKEVVRRLHAPQRVQVLENCSELVTKRLPMLKQHFAAVLILKLPKSHRVWNEFRVVRGNQTCLGLLRYRGQFLYLVGFGRRLRFLVWDDSNGKLIGILAIGDPVFNLSVRDNSSAGTVPAVMTD